MGPALVYLPGFGQAGQCAAIFEIGANQTFADGIDHVDAAEAVPKADIKGIAHGLRAKNQRAAVLRVVRGCRAQGEQQEQNYEQTSEETYS